MELGEIFASQMMYQKVKKVAFLSLYLRRVTSQGVTGNSSQKVVTHVDSVVKKAFGMLPFISH